MIKFSYFPEEIYTSKLLKSEEKDLWFCIFRNKCEGNYCKLSDKELADKLGWAERTVQYHLNHLIEKKYAGKKKYESGANGKWQKCRMIYLNLRNEQELYEPIPTEEDLAKMSDDLCESMKNAIVLGETNFDALVSALKISDYLENVKNNDTQFILTLEQILFLAKLMNAYPNKAIDCQLSTFEDIDYKLLFHEIENSTLLDKDNISLKWCLENYKKIVAGAYRKFEDKQKEVEESPLQKAMKRLGGKE